MPGPKTHGANPSGVGRRKRLPSGRRFGRFHPRRGEALCQYWHQPNANFALLSYCTL